MDERVVICFHLTYLIFFFYYEVATNEKSKLPFEDDVHENVSVIVNHRD